MASENLVKELWEIIQKENKEEISYNDFENDLNKALNLSKDESDRALSLMISQAEVNPNLIGEYKDGSFMISSSFTNIVKSTIKYENQFIPGKAEYEARVISANVKSDVILGALIITPPLLKNMIDDFENLTDKEVEELAGHFYEMDDEDKGIFITYQRDRFKKLKEEAQTNESKGALGKIEDNFNFEVEAYKRMQEGTLDEETKKAYKEEMLKSEEFKKFYFDTTGTKLTEDTELTIEVMDKWFSFSFREQAGASTVINFYDKAQNAIKNGDIEEFARLCTEYPEEAERYLKEFEEIAKKLNIDFNELLGTDLYSMISDFSGMIRDDKSHLADEIENGHGKSEHRDNPRARQPSYYEYDPNEPFSNFVKILTLLPEEKRAAYNYAKELHGQVQEVCSRIKIEALYTEAQKEVVTVGESLRRETPLGREYSEQIQEAYIEKNSEEVVGFDLGVDLETDFETDKSEETSEPIISKESAEDESVEKSEEDENYRKINNVINNNYKEINNNDLLKNDQIKKYFEIYKEDMVVGDVKPLKTTHEDEEHANGEDSGTFLGKGFKERVENAKARLKGRKVAGQIVGILRKIGQVRSGEMVEAHNEIQRIGMQENTIGIEDETISQE